MKNLLLAKSKLSRIYINIILVTLFNNILFAGFENNMYEYLCVLASILCLVNY